MRALQFARVASVSEIQDQARLGTKHPSLRSQYSIDSELIRGVGEQTEQLSDAQRRALNTIRRAINHYQAARILLNGDVGSGKTLVFLLAAAAVARTSRQAVAVMVPSELVARQIHNEALRRFPDLSPTLHVSDFIGNSVGSLMHIGTQALLHRKTHEAYAAIVIDEQQKFSVEQRTQLAGPKTHVIEASATPVPRSLALALFKGWVQALIDTVPVQKMISSHVIRDPGQRMDVIRLVQKHLSAGNKVIFLYPRVQGTSESVVERSKLLSERFPGKVVTIHGKLKADEKVAELSRFRSGECPIAVASTAVEVGVDVPNIGLMVVSSADRFGATQLHQLRGRLVRNGGTGDFVMYVGDSCSRDAIKRLDTVRRLSSGFELAEADLEMRGFGDVLGELQSGKSRSTFLLTKLTAADFLSSPDTTAQG
jgi:ATP-dependent DNA helicase RecG